MKFRVPSVMILGLCAIIGMVFGGCYIYGMRNDIQLKEVTFYGSKEAAKGIGVEIQYVDQGKFGWDVTYQFEEEIVATSEFSGTTSLDRNVASPVRIETDMFEVPNLIGQLEEESTEERTVQISKYFPMMPMDMILFFDSQYGYPMSDVEDIIQVTMPEYAKLRLINQGGSLLVEEIGMPHMEFSVPSVIIEDTMYFTISNLGWSSRHYIDDGNVMNFDYKIQSGIIKVMKKSGAISSKELEYLYPIELNTNKDVLILGLTLLEDTNHLVLATLEEGKQMLSIYSIDSKVMVSQYEIGIISEEREILNYTIKTQDKFILVNYATDLVETDGVNNTLERVGAVFEVTNELEVVERIQKEYYQELKDHMGGTLYIELADAIYDGTKLHLLTRNQQSTGEYYNGVCVITMVQKDVLYFGAIQNHMIEDYTIGDTYGVNTVVGNSQRIIRDIGFMR